jgi:hypothetical protein
MDGRGHKYLHTPGSESRSGSGGEQKYSCTSRESNPGHPARNQSFYRLRNETGSRQKHNKIRKMNSLSHNGVPKVSFALYQVGHRCIVIRDQSYAFGDSCNIHSFATICSNNGTCATMGPLNKVEVFSYRSNSVSRRHSTFFTLQKLVQAHYTQCLYAVAY